MGGGGKEEESYLSVCVYNMMQVMRVLLWAPLYMSCLILF